MKSLKSKNKNVKIIKRSIDSFPEGLCFSTLGGRPILVTAVMNELIAALTGRTMVEVNKIWEDLESGNISDSCKKIDDTVSSITIKEAEKENSKVQSLYFSMPDKTIWHFKRLILDNIEPNAIQITAENITGLFTTSLHLYRNNQKLKEFKKRQKKLLQNIVEINREKEILDAKIKIHDQFGQCLLMTYKALSQDATKDDYAEVAESWINTLNDFSNIKEDTSATDDSQEKELLNVAKMIGCEIIFKGDRPKDKAALKLLYSAIREALTNAVRHAKANKLYVETQETKDYYKISISDNGSYSQRPIKEGMGLSSLREKLEQEGAMLDILYKDSIVLLVHIPKSEVTK